MQEFQSIPGVPDRIFTGSGGSGGEDLRQLRGFPPAASGGPQAPVKCPRCDSTNTKFCYYNNYNLSQPRHFCKSCRRYWTKGGVLRNVPVGGGCRKAKRSSSSAAASKNSKSSSVAGGEKDRRRPPPASRSSSESSGLTAADVSSSACASASASAAFPSSGNPDANLSIDPPRSPSAKAAGREPEIFPPAAGSFTSLMAAAAAGPAGVGFGFTDPHPFRLPAQQSPAPAPALAVGEAEEVKISASVAAVGMLDQTVPEDLRPFQPRSSGGGINGLDWPASVDPGLFDLTGAMDPGAYWSQTHWGDADPSLYLP